MTTFFVSHHPGAIEWATQQRLAVDRFLAHLDPGQVSSSDTVIGTLPVHLAAKVCDRISGLRIDSTLTLYAR